jgi:prepilin-type N-terminal cleavage/methylation domain-containing protein/prepilin-type processing-associated H-X9-DG protein
MPRVIPRRRGFTLIELLVVIAIIAILAAILFPVFAKAREKANQNTCLSNQRQIAIAISMYVQDNDEMLPPAKGWYGLLAQQSGMVGKIWDCPSITHVGTDTQPDYFYVAGSYLAGMALGDVKKPELAPLVGDMAAPDKNPPYINDGGTQNPITAVATPDPRHNGAAVFAFLDGHVETVMAKNITMGFFGPSMNPNVTVSTPTWYGLIADGSVAARDTAQTFYTTCTGLGITKLLYSSAGGGAGTMVCEPAGNATWWAGTPVYTQTTGTRTVYDWNGVRWNGANRVPICGDGDGRTGKVKITITPNASVTAPITKKMMVSYSCWDSLGTGTTKLESIKIGATTTTFNKVLIASGGKVAAGFLAIPVRPAETIEINLDYSSIPGWSGMSLAFEE